MNYLASSQEAPMIVIKKKKVFQELAVSLFLLMEFNADTTSHSIIERLREKGREALKDAAPYTGSLGDKDIKEFLDSKPLKFSIWCGKDIIKGDIIRFIETVFNNKVKPARRLGSRGIIAEVTGMHNPTGSNPILYMRVISSGGTWEIKEGKFITRKMHNVVRMEVMRIPWEDEKRRAERKDILEALPSLKNAAKRQILSRQ